MNYLTVPHCPQDIIEKELVEKTHVYLQAEFVFLRRKCDEVLLQTQNQEKHQTESYKARIKVSITDTVQCSKYHKVFREKCIFYKLYKHSAIILNLLQFIWAARVEQLDAFHMWLCCGDICY